MISHPMTVLVVGSGAREHVLCWSISRNHPERRVLCTPGNGGISEEHRRNMKEANLGGILQLATDEHVDLVVVGPEAPLVAGLVDRLHENNIPAFGPGAAQARLEGSKIFTKQLCDEFGIPTAPWKWTDDMNQAHRILDARAAPSVVKADGLCGGKGVVVASSRSESKAAAAAMLVEKIHGKAGSRIIIEDRLVGRECSIMAFCDGRNAVLLPVARDYKRALDGDAGANTGGMGSYSPLWDVSNDLLAEIKARIIMPTLYAMATLGVPYHGVLYAGIMLTQGGPKLLEYNVRFGDPETQVVLPRLESDIVEYMLACLEPGGLAKLGPLKIKDEAAVCVVLASGGYPGSYKTGYSIQGLKNVPQDVLVFHAGTNSMAELATSGGRVMSVVALGQTVEAARQRANQAADMIFFENKFRRTDIAALKQSSD